MDHLPQHIESAHASDKVPIVERVRTFAHEHDGPLSFVRRSRATFREPIAEFIAVALFVFIGCAADCSVVLSANPVVSATPKGDFFSANIGWAVGLAVAVWVSAGISGGHVNPAVTIAFALFRGFPKKKVPAYIFAQILGGIVGAGLAYSQFYHLIDRFDGGVKSQTTAGLFAAYPLQLPDTPLPAATCFFSEFLGTAVLLISIMATTDLTSNAAPPLYMLPVAIFLTLLGLAVAIGMLTAFSFNPARDLGCRLFLSMVGYNRHIIWNFRSQYWLWCPFLGPIGGAICGVVFYDLFLRGTVSPSFPPPGGLDKETDPVPRLESA